MRFLALMSLFLCGSAFAAQLEVKDFVGTYQVVKCSDDETSVLFEGDKPRPLHLVGSKIVLHSAEKSALSIDDKETSKFFSGFYQINEGKKIESAKRTHCGSERETYTDGNGIHTASENHVDFACGSKRRSVGSFEFTNAERTEAHWVYEQCFGLAFCFLRTRIDCNLVRVTQ